MADTLSVTIEASFKWLLSSPIDLSTPVDSGSLSFSRTLTNGTAVDQADKMWADQRVITAAANDDLDVTALTNTIFGATVTVNFVKLKAIAIYNTNTTAGDRLRLDSSVANGLTGPFNGSATSKVEIGPNSVCVLGAMKDGFSTAISGTNKVVRINNPSANSITYKIVMIGTSA